MATMVIVSGTAFAGCFGPPPPPPTNQAPFAVPTISSNLVAAADTVRFNASGQDADGTITTWRWNFGDGTNATGQNVTHVFSHQGSFFITLNVTDNGGATYDTIRTAVPLRLVVFPKFAPTTPEDHPLAALSLGADSSVIRPGDRLMWNATGSRGSWNGEASAPGIITTYMMDFGDGATESHDNVSLETGTWNGSFAHTYASEGVFSAHLTVTSNTAVTDAAYWTVVSVGVTHTVGLKNPDTLIIESFGQPNNLDPAIAYDDASNEIIQAVYETLVTYDGSQADQYVPMLALELPSMANGLITNNSTTYTFNLRHNVTFHSGNPLTAADVVFSFQRMLTMDDPASATWIYNQTLNQTGIVALDDYTVQFNLERPYGPFISTLAFSAASIVSKKTVNDNGGVQMNTRNTWMLTHMDGTGPFTLRSWDSGQQVVLDKNPNYWNPAKAAKVNHVIHRLVIEFSSMLLDLRNGDADIIAVNSRNLPSVTPYAGSTVEKIVVQKGAATWNILTGMFNQEIDNSTAGRARLAGVPNPDNVPSDFFADQNMRKAFSLAFDYSDYIDNVTKGLTVRLNGVIPSGMYGYNPNIAAAPFDLEGARAAYNQTKWVTNSTYNPGGRAAGFNLTVGYNCGNTNRQAYTEILKRGVELLGPNIRVNAQCFEFSAYLDIISPPSGKPGPLGSWVVGWGPDYADPDDYVLPFLQSGNAYPKYNGVSNASLDGLMDQAAQALNSPARQALYDQIQTSAVNNYYYVYLTQAVNIHVAKTWVKGWYYNPMLQGADLGGNLATISKE